MAVRLDSIRDEIIGLRPVYTNTGNSTIIYLRHGEVEDHRGIRTIILALARLHSIDLAAQRLDIIRRLFRHGVLPFYLSLERVFVPFKMRKTVASKDMVYGYVDVKCMKDIQATGGRRCLLSIGEGREIEILSQRTTVLHSQHMGQRLLDMLQSERTGDQDEREAVGSSLYWHRHLKSMRQDIEEIKFMVAKLIAKDKRWRQ